MKKKEVARRHDNKAPRKKQAGEVHLVVNIMGGHARHKIDKYYQYHKALAMTSIIEGI